MASPALTVAAQTHPGKLRKENQDHVFADVRPLEQGGLRALLVVADGLGGHTNGARASQIVVETLQEKFASFLSRSDVEDTQPLGLEDAMDNLSERLRLAILAADQNIGELTRGSGGGEPQPASTLVVALVQGRRAVLAHAGDSRAYLLRGAEFKQLTQDHSFVGELIRANKLPESAVYDHPRRNVVLRALGQGEDVEPELQVLDLQPGDKLLLCSDGLWGMVEEPGKIAKILQANPPQKACKKLIDLANKLGGEDNISAAIVELAEA